MFTKEFMMKMLVMNRKITLSILMMIVLICSFQGVNHVAEAVTVPGDPAFSDLIAAQGNDNLFQALLERATRLCEGLEFPRDTFAINDEFTVLVAHTSSGSGLVIQGNFRYESGGPIDLGWLTLSPRGAVRVLTRYAPSGASIICVLDEPSNVSASVASPFTETTLDEGVVTLTLKEYTYEQDISKIREAVTVSGITGVTVDPTTVQRISGTEVTVALTFNGTDFDADATLIFNVASGAIADYTGDAFTAEVPVTAIEEGVVTSVVSPLTEATLDESVVTLTLTGLIYEPDVSKIRDAVTVFGITGVTVVPATVQRLSDTEIMVELDFDWTNFDADATLTFNVASGAIADYTGDAFTAEVPVTAIEEGVVTSVVSPLTEATLDESVVTLTLTGLIYEPDVSKIRDAVTVFGITGVTVVPATVQRLSDTEIMVELDFDWTNFDADATLTFNVASGAIADYTGDTFTAEVPVTAIKGRVEISVSASVVSPLTEATLSESTVTLTLTGAAYEQDLSKIRDAVTVSGIAGVTVNSTKVQRLSDRKVTFELGFDGTDFDTDTALVFNIGNGAIANYTGDDFTAEVPVTAVKESVSASVVSPLTEKTLDGSFVALVLIGATYEQDMSKIRNSVTVSGIDGVSLNTANFQRVSDRQIKVALDFDGTDFERDTALFFTVSNSAITNYEGPTLTTEIPVTPIREEQVSIFWVDGSTIRRANLDSPNGEAIVTGLNTPAEIALDLVHGKIYWTDIGTDKIQCANLDGSDVQDLVTQGLNDLRGIALDVEDGKMYWTNWGEWSWAPRKIQRANLDGSNVEDLITSTLIAPFSIALDVADGKMYWTNSTSIMRANLDGSNRETLVRSLDSLQDIALDVADGKMYWTNWGEWSWAPHKIQRANLDGSNVKDLIIQGLKDPNSITLDVEGGKMYWTDTRTDKIQRANLDGSNIEDLVTQGLDSPRGIAVGITSRIPPATAKEDVNRDGVVDVQDLAYVGLQYGRTGANTADVNGDEIVNVDDFISVAAAVDSAAAAPAARAQVQSHFTKAQLQRYLTEARASENTSHTYQRGIAVVERLLALFTPEETALLANYPNPFNPETWIPYQLAKSADVTLTIYGIDGRVVRQLALGHQAAGVYQARTRAAHWDGRNALGEPAASGVYFYTLTAGDFTATRKMLILK